MWRGAHKPPAHRKRLRRRQPRPRRQRLRRGARLPLLQRRAMGRRHHHQPTIRSSAGVRRAGTKDDPHRTEGSHVPEAHLPRRTGTSRAVPPYPPHPRMGQPITTEMRHERRLRQHQRLRNSLRMVHLGERLHRTPRNQMVQLDPKIGCVFHDSPVRAPVYYLIITICFLYDLNDFTHSGGTTREGSL